MDSAFTEGLHGPLAIVVLHGLALEALGLAVGSVVVHRAERGHPRRPDGAGRTDRRPGAGACEQVPRTTGSSAAVTRRPFCPTWTGAVRLQEILGRAYGSAAQGGRQT
jgi:hypothetical protein